MCSSVAYFVAKVSSGCFRVAQVVVRARLSMKDVTGCNICAELQTAARGTTDKHKLDTIKQDREDHRQYVLNQRVDWENKVQASTLYRPPPCRTVTRVQRV